jgi:5-methylthioadenosine/S-adenosylhomocysteine deaminase
MKIRFYNARIMTMENGCDIFEGELWVSDRRIVFVGDENAVSQYHRSEEKAAFKWDREIDCEGDLLMPGVKNAHTHSAMTLMRSLADDLPTGEWLNEQIFPVEAHMTGDDIYFLTQLAILEYLTSGITSVFDMYLTPQTIAAACRDAGMRCVQVGCVNNFSQSLELVEQMYNELNTGDDSLNSYIMGFHAEYTCSLELLRRFSDLVHRYRAPVFTHIAETRAETDECRERYGMSPVKFLDSLGLFDFGGGGYHMVHIDEDDMRIMKERNMFMVTNPGSNLKLASGIAPVMDCIRHGISVAIGTDGPASNNALDFFREMFLVSGLAKIRDNSAAAMDAGEVLKMAVVNGAHAMGLNDCDCLAPGKKADLIRIDM